MAETQPPKDSDAQRGELRSDSRHEINTQIQRTSALATENVKAALNYQAPVIQRDATGPFYASAPRPLKRQFGSPLLKKVPANYKGEPVLGPNGERLVTSSWGDSRSFGTDNNIDHGRRHGGLDFRAPVGEAVLAAADGKVTFVGYQGRPSGGHKVDHPHTKNNELSGTNAGVVFNSKDEVVAYPGAGLAPLGTPPSKILGHGGVFVQIKHNGDFAGYLTEYMHLSNTSVTLGQPINEGDEIGKVGRTGGNKGIIPGPHLHFQIRFATNYVIVKPEALVPHYAKGKSSDTENATTIPAISPFDAHSVIEQLMLGNAAGAVQALSRATTLEKQCGVNRDVVRSGQAAHFESVAKTLSMHTSALLESIAKFQEALPVVSNAMSFDFDNGIWTDNGEPV